MDAAIISCAPDPEYLVRSGLNLRGVPNTPPVQKVSKLVVPARTPPRVLNKGWKSRLDVDLG